MSVKKIQGYTIRVDKWLGHGSFGFVYEGVKDSTNEKVAIKQIEKKKIEADSYNKQALISQIHILRSVKSENIVQFVDVMESDRNYYVIQQLCEFDLECLMNKKKKFTEAQALDMLFQISNGFLVLVRQGIIHRDLKPANILIKDGKLKIADFGFAKKVNNKYSPNISCVGTPLYSSLQLLLAESYSSKVDIWAIGFIFYELLHGKTPYKAETQFQLVQNIKTQKIEISQQLGQHTKDFISKCLGVEQKDRISWDDYFVHPIFQGRFNKYADQNKQFEDKLKTLMVQLRYKINSQNLDLKTILQHMGLKQPQNQLSFQQFKHFIEMLSPQITSEEIVYMFEKTDFDNNGKISLKQIQILMNRYHIPFRSISIPLPFFKPKVSKSNKVNLGGPSHFISVQTSIKLQKSFVKMKNIIQNKKITLSQVFNIFDKEKNGKLSFNQFKHMLNKLRKDFTDQELQAIFKFIDNDGSNSIDFAKFNSYYSRVNNISEKLNEAQNANNKFDNVQLWN